MSWSPTIRPPTSDFFDICESVEKIVEPSLEQLKLLARQLGIYSLPSGIFIFLIYNKWLCPDTKIPNYIYVLLTDKLSVPILFAPISLEAILLFILIALNKILAKFSDKKAPLAGFIFRTSDWLSNSIYSFASIYTWGIFVIWFYQHSFNRFYRAPFLDAIVLSVSSLSFIFFFVLYIKLLLAKWYKI